MNYRLSTLLAEQAEDSDITRVIDINVVDPISALQILHRGQNTAGVEGTAHPAACVTKIELVDGSEVLLSLSGYEVQALDYYNRGVEMHQWLQYLNDNWFDMVYNINFGRFLYDPELALDPKKFNNLQLKISLDVNAGGVAPDHGKLAVYANLFDEKLITPVGFLMSKEIKEYQMGSATHEYTDLPVDFPYRKLLFKALIAGTPPNQAVDNLKLSEDQDKRIVFDVRHSDLTRLAGNQRKPFVEYIVGQATSTSKNFYCTPTMVVCGAVNSWVAASPSYHLFYHGDGGRFQTLGETGKNWIATVTGFCPHGVLEIPFGLQDRIEDWYDVSRIGSLKLDVLSYAGGSGNNAQIFLQQLRRY